MFKHIKHLRGLSSLANLFKVSILTSIFITIYGIFEFALPLFVEEFTASMTLIGLTLSAVYGASFLFELPAGVLVDALGEKRSLILGLVVLASITGLYFLSKDIYMALVASILFGIFSVLYWISSESVVRRSTPEKMEARSQGIYFTFAQFGWIIGPILCGIIANYLPIRYTFLAMGILLLAAAIYVCFIFKHKAKKALKVERLKKLAKPQEIFLDFFKLNKQALPVFVLSIIAYMWIGLEFISVELAAEHSFHFSIPLIAVLIGAMMAVEGALYFVSSYLMDIVGKKWILVAGFFLMFASLYFAFLTPLPWVFMFSLLLGAGAVAWTVPGTEAVITEIAPKEKLGEVTAVFDSSKDIGLMLSPVLAGIFADLSGNAQAPFLMISILAAVAVFIALKIRR